MSRREKPVWTMLCHVCGKYFRILSPRKDKYLSKAESVAAKLSDQVFTSIAEFLCLKCKKKLREKGKR